MPDNTDDFTMEWKHVAVSAGVVAVAAIGGLIASIVIKTPDILALVALVLAVIAFLAQVLIFAAQGATSIQQMKQSQELSSEAQRVLNRIAGSLEGAHSVLTEWVDTLMRHAFPDMPSRKRAAQIGDMDIGGSYLVAAETFSALGVKLSRRYKHDNRWRALHRFPERDKVDDLFQNINMLSVLAVGRLVAYGISLRVSLLVDEDPYLILGDDRFLSDELTQHGFVRIDTRNEKIIGELTDEGIEAASLFLAEGTTPDYIRERNIATLVPSEQSAAPPSAAAPANDADKDRGEADSRSLPGQSPVRSRPEPDGRAFLPRHN
jgi:hypothetical protein